MARVAAAVASLLVACLLVAAPAAAPAAAPEAPGVLLDDVLESLYYVLKFLIDHPSDLIADTVFGVVIGKGQLKNLEQVIPKFPDKFIFQPSRRMYVLLATKILEKMCEEIATVPLAPAEDSPGYDILMDKLLRFEMWEFDRPMRRRTLLDTDAYRLAEDPVLNVSRGHRLTLEQYSVVADSGSPTEPDSDRCIVEIVNSSSCVPSKECRQIETGGRRPTGYATTHRLLYLQVARQNGCGNSPHFIDLDNRIKDLCAGILKEAEFIDREGVTPILQDLFIEQIVLCGIEGFAEFVRPEWIRKIVSLQRPEGCYGDVAELNQEVRSSSNNGRVKRNDVETAYGCMMHITGLAASALAMSARALVEMYGL